MPSDLQVRRHRPASQAPGILWNYAPRDSALLNCSLDGSIIKDYALEGSINAWAQQWLTMAENTKPGPNPSVPDDEILSLFRDTSDPVLSTAEVAEQIPLARRSVYDRLVSLREKEEVESKEIGGRNTVWWIPTNE